MNTRRVIGSQSRLERYLILELNKKEIITEYDRQNLYVVLLLYTVVCKPPPKVQTGKVAR